MGCEKKSIYSRSFYFVILLGITGKRKIITDVSATDETIDLLCTQVQNGGGVVLANKLSLSDELHVFEQLTLPSLEPYMGFDATIGGGLPYVRTLIEHIHSGKAFMQN